MLFRSATGMGYLTYAFLFMVIIGLMTVLLSSLDFGEPRRSERELKITIPENLDYTELFDDLFTKYTSRSELIKVKTTHMGSLYELHYHVVLNGANIEKELLDQIRCRNGNLNITCGRAPTIKEEL